MNLGISIPLGIDSFTKVREENFYYIDKTLFIKELLSTRFEANLITRPRRFGKTMTMSMLEDFFEISRDSKAHFEGLKISKEKELCKEWMNQYPVVFLTLKDVEGLNYRNAYGMLRVLISDLCKKYEFLGDSSSVNEADREIFRELEYQKADQENLKSSLAVFMRMMNAHYGRQVILLIDEYDVPLAKASENGYYEEMLEFIRALLGKALKTNPYLKFAVVTGCLRISKESIFTGTNNFVTNSITGDGFNEYIGFIPSNVRSLLADWGLSEHEEDVKLWYDGYRFGRTEVYCPWDVLSYVRDLSGNPNAKPQNYWGNTSHNGVIRQFIDRKDLREKENINADIEKLIAGEIIRKSIREDLTYDTLHSASQNLWSLLLLTGYLTIEPSAEETNTEKAEAEEYSAEYSEDAQEVSLRIPNEEVRMLFRTTVQEWFTAKVKSEERTELFEALWSKNEQRSSKKISEMVYDTISYYDYREDFYRAFMAGILSYAGYELITNKEMGEGRSDIVLKDERNDRAMVIELKWTQTKAQMSVMCEEALRQIKDKRYAEGLEKEFDQVVCCGICFYKKQCAVRFEC